MAKKDNVTVEKLRFFGAIQEEHRGWVRRNYPGMDEWRALVKVGEEVGELIEAGGVVGLLEDEAADVLIALVGFCNEFESSLLRDIFTIHLPEHGETGETDQVVMRYGDLCRALFRLQYDDSKRRARLRTAPCPPAYAASVDRVNVHVAIKRLFAAVGDVAYPKKLEEFVPDRWAEVKARFPEEPPVPQSPPPYEVKPHPPVPQASPANHDESVPIAQDECPEPIPCDEPDIPF